MQPIICGCAAVFNRPFQVSIDGRRVLFEPARFDSIDLPVEYVICCIDHDQFRRFDDTLSGTFRLWIDNHGPHFECRQKSPTSVGRLAGQGTRHGFYRGASVGILPEKSA